MSELATFIERKVVVLHFKLASSGLCGKNQQVRTSLPPVASYQFVRLVDYWELEDEALLF